ncbi:Sugar kinase of the NBD/HSP70 family, may contain an N-terminal HTH domain [Evansella caseinilytica]|uniref:Sugar kinase of the NBD/HSP70 family, may contain an N-terminal HTH domain n=1 Tax=Evansella caseinilytica TaxID=1503961 RepID=A0A1H3SLC4_9BACI|nr:ROK family protein [Evansella caseinilytica]SDZ38385.1 Sugar kinase of the NBD/HSP70 family, may contain an N-terminal HTH domain [Evansella caseinilytica]
METTPKAMKKTILLGIRKTLLELESATKVELSDYLGISFPTISKFLAQMENDREVFVLGLDHSSGGRRPKRYAYNPEYMLGLAIFLERAEIHYLVFNCFGEIKAQGEKSRVLGGDDLKQLTECIQEITEEFPKIRSISIGVPGSVNNEKIFFIPGYEQLQNCDLKGYIENTFSMPVVIENDMNASVLGYQRSKQMQTDLSIIYVYLGKNGPGAGILVNGEVVRGSTCFSGEVSFVPQYDKQNFQQALENASGGKIELNDKAMDALSRLVASFIAIINPHTIIFSDKEVDIFILDQLIEQSSNYIPTEHLPEFIVSDWKQDYLFGLKCMCLDLMIKEIKDTTVSNNK